MCEVGSTRQKFASVIDQIAASSDANSMRVRFLWSKIYNNASISNCLIFWNELDFLVRHDKY